MNQYNVIAIAFTALLLAGCQTLTGIQQDFGKMVTAIDTKISDSKAKEVITTANAGKNCPPLAIDPQFDRAYEFYEMKKPSEKTKISSIRLIGAQSECTLDDEYLNMQIDLSFAGKIGPMGRRKKDDKPFFSYPYFIAVTNDKGHELAREIFSASITYDKGEDEMKLVETIKQRLPLNDGGSLPPYQIQAGIQLTEEQLFYNASQE